MLASVSCPTQGCSQSAALPRDAVSQLQHNWWQVFEVEPSTGDTTTRGSITFPLQHHCSFGEDVECKYLELHTAEGVAHICHHHPPVQLPMTPISNSENLCVSQVAR